MVCESDVRQNHLRQSIIDDNDGLLNRSSSTTGRDRQRHRILPRHRLGTEPDLITAAMLSRYAQPCLRPAGMGLPARGRSMVSPADGAFIAHSPVAATPSRRCRAGSAATGAAIGRPPGGPGGATARADLILTGGAALPIATSSPTHDQRTVIKWITAAIKTCSCCRSSRGLPVLIGVIEPDLRRRRLSTRHRLDWRRASEVFAAVPPALAGRGRAPPGRRCAATWGLLPLGQ